jgi:glutamyl-tRNA reductase
MSAMRICLLGQNHRSAPIEWREQLAFNPEKERKLAEIVKADPLHSEAAVLSTCNRVELYAVSQEPEHSRRRLTEYLETVHGLRLDSLEQTLYFHQDQAAVRHLFAVASGLDSMVLGEGQVLAQVREAQVHARESDLMHRVLTRAFNDAVHCGKRVRSDTRLGEGAVSVAYAAVTLARKIFDDLSRQTVLLLGAGETGRRVARHLQLFGVRDLRVSNRNRERGEELAHELHATLVPWDRVLEQLPQVSILVSATAASEPILQAEDLRKALRRGGRRNLFCVDLAVPRDIESEASRIPGVFLYNVDDLQGIVLEGEDLRRAEADKAERIVDEEVEHFLQWYRAHAVAPVLHDLRRKMEGIREDELSAVRGTLDPASYAALERVTHRMLQKFLHAPTLGLKRMAQQNKPEDAVRDFSRIFDLDERQRDRDA